MRESMLRVRIIHWSVPALVRICRVCLIASSGNGQGSKWGTRPTTRWLGYKQARWLPLDKVGFLTRIWDSPLEILETITPSWDHTQALMRLEVTMS